MEYKELFYNALAIVIEYTEGNVEKALDYCGINSEENRCRIKKRFPIEDDERFIKTVNSPVNVDDFAEALIANDIAFSYGKTGLYVYKEDFDIAKIILKGMEEREYDIIFKELGL